MPTKYVELMFVLILIVSLGVGGFLLLFYGSKGNNKKLIVGGSILLGLLAVIAVFVSIFVVSTKLRANIVGTIMLILVIVLFAIMLLITGVGDLVKSASDVKNKETNQALMIRGSILVGISSVTLIALITVAFLFRAGVLALPVLHF